MHHSTGNDQFASSVLGSCIILQEMTNFPATSLDHASFYRKWSICQLRPWIIHHSTRNDQFASCVLVSCIVLQEMTNLPAASLDHASFYRKWSICCPHIPSGIGNCLICDHRESCKLWSVDPLLCLSPEMRKPAY